MLKLSSADTVDTFWEKEAEVWIATSKDGVGRVTEALTIEQLTQKLHTIVHKLIELNHLSNHQGAMEYES